MGNFPILKVELLYTNTNTIIKLKLLNILVLVLMQYAAYYYLVYILII